MAKLPISILKNISPNQFGIYRVMEWISPLWINP
jgi:hypothetical protein